MTLTLEGVQIAVKSHRLPVDNTQKMDREFCTAGKQKRNQFDNVEMTLDTIGGYFLNPGGTYTQIKVVAVCPTNPAADLVVG